MCKNTRRAISFEIKYKSVDFICGIQKGTTTKIKSLSRTILSVLVILSMLASIPVFAEDKSSDYEALNAEILEYEYDYIVQPLSNEWQALSYDDQVTARQIPDSKLNLMSTNQLVSSIFNSDYIVFLCVYDTFYEGYHHLSENYNAVSELENRQDAAQCLLLRYTTLAAEMESNPNSSLSLETMFLETFLAQGCFVNQMSVFEWQTLEDTLYRINAIKDANPDIRCNSNFYETLSYSQPTVRVARSEYWVTTPKGTRVPVYIGRDEPWGLSTVHDAFEQLGKPGATPFYETHNPNNNCHTYAWYSQDYTVNYRMVTPSPYWGDGSYTETTDRNGRYDARVYWTSGNHSAISLDSTGSLVRSKWGKICEVESTIGECPYSGSVKFYQAAW